MMQNKEAEDPLSVSIAGQDCTRNEGEKGKEGNQITDLLGGGGPEEKGEQA